MADFTIGPWQVSKRAARRVTNNTGVVICNAVLRNRGGPKHKRELKDEHEAEANAQLIAAAPDLLEALGRCEVIIDDFVAHLSPEEQALDPEVGETLTAVRAAIAKATGGAL